MKTEVEKLKESLSLVNHMLKNDHAWEDIHDFHILQRKRSKIKKAIQKLNNSI